MKKIIKRNLPLNVKYTCIDKKYIPILDGGGCVCDNCGKLISNIATVKSVNGTYSIGFDCLETFIINNNLIEGFDFEAYENEKRSISKIIRISKKLKETISKNKGINITGLYFESVKYKTDYYPFYWLKNNETRSRDNDYVKCKEINFDFMINALKNIFPKLNIITD